MKRNQSSDWIWSGDWNACHNSVPTLVLFRKELLLEKDIKKSVINISADSRYKLYINQQLIGSGPSKGDLHKWYYDEIDVTSYLKQGKNVIAIEVLRYPMKPGDGNQSIISTTCPGLYFSAEIMFKDGSVVDYSADKTWKCIIDENTEIISEAKGFAPLHIYENVKKNKQRLFFKDEDYDDSMWKDAVSYDKAVIRDAVSPGNIHKREIPYLYLKERCFKSISAVRKSKKTKECWEKLLCCDSDTMITIEPHSEEIIEIDAGEEMTAYLSLCIAGGEDSEIEILQTEAYAIGGKTPNGGYLKGNREDSVNGRLIGYADNYVVNGDGKNNHPECYEPFWFRTFRFIKLSIRTKSKPLTILKFNYQETGYPLAVKSHVETSDESLKSIWDISERTLKRCMMDTYMDCPYYEQLQYIMDARAQILYTYASSADDRLARQCMDDLKRAQRYDGLMFSAYPNTRPNIIPGFSLYYVLMLHDHMMYFGDKEFVRYHMTTVENVLNFFMRNIAENGLLGQIGGLYRQAKYWSFIDWSSKWQIGVPNATAKGPITMESLLLVLGLQKASELADFLGRKEQCAEYKTIASDIQNSIRNLCTGKNGMIQDGPGFDEYSQHCQVFAILTDTIDKETGRKNLEETILNEDDYAQCTVSMTLYLFEALRKSGLYEYTDKYWNKWRRMIAHNMTTCAESDPDEYSRSDCHAWGAVALFELHAVVLGVRPAAPGCSKIFISPEAGYLKEAKGEAVTPKGSVYVQWTINNGHMDIEYKVPDGIEVIR